MKRGDANRDGAMRVRPRRCIRVAVRAGEQVANAPTAMPPARTWYGWQVLAADGVAMTTWLYAGSQWRRSLTTPERDTLFALGFATYGLISFGAVGSHDLNPGRYAEVGLLVGYLTAVAVDSAVLSYDVTPDPPRFAWTPAASVSSRSGMIGLHGVF